MTASVVLTGLGANYWLPNIYIETNFAQGPATGSGLVRAIVVLANKTTAGGATVDTVIYGPDSQVPLQTEADMVALGGTGGEAHRLFRRIAKVNKTTPVYWVFVTESAGANATGTIVIGTGNASANGNHRTWVGDEYVDTPIVTGQTPTTIGANVAAAINAMSHWPVTAASVTGTVTLTAKNKGDRSNWIRFMAAITPGINTTTTGTTDAFLTGGTTADSNTAALATIYPKRHYYIVSAAGDSVQFGAVVTQVGIAAAPTVGKRQRAFTGSVDTLANAITLATTINNPRAEVIWHEKSPFTPAELAANNAAIYALEEANESNPRTNFIGYGNDPATADKWLVPPSRVASAAPSDISLNSAGNNGLTPIAVNDRGTRTYLVDRITTKSLSGSIADYRIRDAHKVTITDFVGDALYAKLSLQNAGKRIADDPPPGAPPPPAGVTTPAIVKGQVIQVLNEFGRSGLLQNLDTIKAGLIVQRGTNPTSRMEIRVPLECADNFRQGAVSLDQVAGLVAVIGSLAALAGSFFA